MKQFCGYTVWGSCLLQTCYDHNILRLDRRRLGQRREKEEGAAREVMYTEDGGHNQEGSAF